MNFPKFDNFIDIHSHKPEEEEGVFRVFNAFSSDYPQVPSGKPISIGLHPWHISEEEISRLPAVLKKGVNLHNMLAFGETGMDSIIKTPLNEQINIFRTHIEAGIQYNKPLIIHCVKAFPELLSLRKEYPKATPWIIHGFNSNQTVAAECINMGIYISLSQRLFRNAEKAKQIISQVPLSSIFAETDDDAGSISEVYETAADLYGKSVGEIKEHILKNFNRVFSGN